MSTEGEERDFDVTYRIVASGTIRVRSTSHEAAKNKVEKGPYATETVDITAPDENELWEQRNTSDIYVETVGDKNTCKEYDEDGDEIVL
jgi:hypothetical protein